MAWKNWGDNPYVVALGAFAALATILPLGYALYTKGTSPTTLSQSPDSAKFRLRVLDDQNKPLSGVKVIISSSSPSDMGSTDTLGYIEFQVPLKSSQIKLSLSKDNYEQENYNNLDVETYINTTREFHLKKKLIQSLR